MNGLMDALVQFGPDLIKATLDTFMMVGATMVSAIVLGTPLGIMLFLTAAFGLYPQHTVHRLTSYFVNVLRSFPFIILLVLLIPFSRFLVGTSIGPKAAAVALSIAVIPYFARLVEQNLRDVPRGMVDIRYGYYRFETNVMIWCVIIMFILVQVTQWLGDRLVRLSDKRV